MPRTELAFDTCYGLRGFGVSRKGIENERQKASKNDPKIEFWAPRGRLFEFLGGFLRGLIFDEFLICKNSAENQKKNATEAQKGDSAARVGGRGGVQQRLLESARVSKSQQESAKSIWHASCPCKQGAADLRATASAADPERLVDEWVGRSVGLWLRVPRDTEARMASHYATLLTYFTYLLTLLEFNGIHGNSMKFGEIR